MKNRDAAIEAVATVLRNSAAADSSLHDSDMRDFAADIVAVVEEIESGKSIELAVVAHWDLDGYQRSREFGPTDAEYDAMDAEDYDEMREAGQLDD